MSKKTKSRGHRDESASETTASPPAEKAPRKKLTVPERMLAKVQVAETAIKETSALVTFYRAPLEPFDEIFDSEYSPDRLLAYIEKFKEQIQLLIARGWQPAAKSSMKELQAGDSIAIATASAELYSYIPSDAALVAGRIERSENGRIKRILLTTVDGLTFGWAPVSHLERR